MRGYFEFFLIVTFDTIRCHVVINQQNQLNIILANFISNDIEDC